MARGTRSRVGVAAAAVAWAASLLLVCQAAAAEPYQNDGAHYGFTAPDGWESDNNTTGDVGYLGPPDAGYRPNLLVDHEASPAAQNSSAWVLDLVRTYFEDVNSSLNISVVQGPRAFVAGSGRIAGDFLYNLSFGGFDLRQRQVFFVSEYHATVYSVIFTDKVSTFNLHAQDWALVVDSLHVDGERINRTAPPSTSEPPPSDDFLILAGGAMTAAGAIMVAVAYFRMKPRSAQPPPSAPAAYARPPARARPHSPPPVEQRPPSQQPRLEEGDAFRTSPPRRSVGPPPSQRSAYSASAFPGEPAPRRKRPPAMPAPGAVVEGRPAQAPPAGAGGPLGAPPAPRPAPPRPAAPARPPAAAPQAPPAAALQAPPAAPAPAPAPARARPPAPAPPPTRAAGQTRPAASPPAPKKIRCPKCGTHFPGPTTRPATVQCPQCGTKGVMK